MIKIENAACLQVPTALPFIPASHVVVGLTGRAQPIQRCPVDEDMMLQAIEYAHVMGKNLQLLKDQKKILRQENVALRELIEKLPSTLQSELHSVHEDVLAKMHIISFKINALIQTYTKFQTEPSAMPRSHPFFYMNTGAVQATEEALIYLRACKELADVYLVNNGLEKTSKKALKKLLKSEVVAPKQNETAVVALGNETKNNVIAPSIAARFQQIAEKVNTREIKVAQMRADNSVLQKQIETLESGSQNIGKAFRRLVEIYSLDPCLRHLRRLQEKIPVYAQRAIDTVPTLTRTRDKNEFKGYIERYQVIQTDISALSSQIQEINQAFQGAY